MNKKHISILFTVILLGLFFGLYQYSKNLEVESVFATSTVPNPGHLWSSMECNSDSLCLDTTNNRLGIGTASPAARLAIALPTSGTGRQDLLQLEHTAQNTFLVSGFGQSHAVMPATVQLAAWNSEQNISIVTDSLANVQAGGSTKGIFIKSGGNVGIGTTSPNFKLEVLGSVNIGDGPFVIASGANSLSFYDQLSGAFFHTPGAMVRKDSATTDMTQAPATMVLYNKNGTDNSGAKLVFASNETTVAGSNPVALAAITSQKITGVAGSWATGNLKFLIKSGATYVDAMTINASGNVGIGTTSPSFPLNVVKDVTMDGDLTAGTAQLSLSGSTVPGKRMILGYDTNGNGFGYIKAGNYGVSWTNLALQPSGGSVGIGTTSPSYTLTVAGTAWVTSGAWSGSDVRWKKNINTLSTTSSLDQILKLNPVNYEWRTDEFPDMKFTTGTQLGFIAQDMEKVIPEVVTTDNNGYKGISYEKIVPVLTSAMQEQQKEIEALSNENKELKVLVCLDHPSADICK